MEEHKSKILSEYSKALREDANTVVSNTGNAKFADYSETELSNLPPGVEKYSFGCGNPLAFSDVQPGQTVLDLGCGAGLDLLLAVERVGEKGKVIGLDINDDMIALAKKRTSAFNNVEVRKGEIESMPVESHSIDWVISNCVINLSPSKQQVFQEISRVLKPNGRILISDIVADKLPWWVRRSGVLNAACGGGVISERKYLEGLKSAGLEECRVVSRHYYEPNQLASIVSEPFPSFIKRIRCCGYPLLQSLLIKLAEPISKNLWSAKFSASAKSV
jgi:SAM-dependent methyltransferase